MIRVTLIFLCDLRLVSGWIFDFLAPGRWTTIQYLFSQPKHMGQVPDLYFGTVEAQKVGKPRLPFPICAFLIANSIALEACITVLDETQSYSCYELETSGKQCPRCFVKFRYGHPKRAQNTEKCCPKGNEYKWCRATIWRCPRPSGLSFLNEKNFWDTSQLFFFEFERCWCWSWCLGTIMYQECITLLSDSVFRKFECRFAEF